MHNKKAIIFDFDGVIADSLGIAFEVNKLKRATLTLERYQAAFNGNIYDAAFQEEVTLEIDFPEEFSKRLMQLEIDPLKKYYIRKLSDDFHFFIISSSMSDAISAYLSKHEILNHFTEILGADIHTSKVTKFHMIFDQHNLKPDDVIFITDTSGDIAEAKKVGIKTTVGILGGYQTEENLQKGDPMCIVKDFEEFYDFVYSGQNLKLQKNS